MHRRVDNFVRTGFNLDLQPNSAQSPSTLPKLPTFKKVLINACNSKCRNVDLKFFPESFERSKLNKTRINKKTKIMFWTVEFLFNKDNVKKMLHDLNETISLKELLNYKENSKKLEKINRKPNKEDDNYCSSNIFVHLVHQEIENFDFYLKKEGGKADALTYFKLDINETLKFNLTGKLIHEFPTITILEKNNPNDTLPTNAFVIDLERINAEIN
ncbi:hypothetical protein HK099_003411 [Clydaea vesicula]|uniref:BCD1 alpha/beta domain-containing protein n=1 Tax=Clydaea vesicula TaxID=447962 RepID=A0AAD5TSS2_9FUNG|nr:hypothetical protein HK099_003411 [Clydaea vesicula]